MTDLMKRYEAETGNEVQHNAFAQHEIWEYIRWLEFEYEKEKVNYAKLEEIHIAVLRDASKRKAQLTWRPASEKPEKDVKCIGKFNDEYDGTEDDFVFYNAKFDQWSRQVQNCFESWETSHTPPIAYFVIPPMEDK